MSKKKMICVSSVLLALSVLVCLVTVRVHSIDCAHCQKNIYKVSTVELCSKYWRNIPILHRNCLDHIATVLAPREGVTVGEYFEARGWEPRHAETKGKTWKEIVE